MKFKRFCWAAAVAVATIFLVACAGKEEKTAGGVSEGQSVKVTLNLNGGVLSGGESVIYLNKDKIALPEPEREGFTFAGWYADSDFSGSKYIYLDPEIVVAELQLWAKWDELQKAPGQTDGGEEDPPNEDSGGEESGGGGNGGSSQTKIFSIAYELNGGVFNTSNFPSRYVAGQEFVLPVPHKGGWIFAGWYETRDFSSERVLSIQITDRGNKIFYAKWEKAVSEPKQEFLLIFKLNGGNFKEGETVPEKYTQGETMALPVPVSEGREFAGWYVDKDFSGEPMYEIPADLMGDKILYAKWV